MKITLAQLNPTVGDVAHNLDKLLAAWELGFKSGSDLVVLPELYLVGYPPQDLLEKKWFLEKTGQLLTSIIQASERFGGTALLLGIPVANEAVKGKGLFNSALLIGQGRILAARHKSLLPTYDVFDECRYFDPAHHNQVVPYKGEQLGITICEDAWNSEELWPEQRMYEFDPVEDLVRQGASILINISASPFHAGKERLRFNLMQNHARKHGVPFVYVNQVGGNDELVFDGSSMLIDGKGRLSFLAPSFQESVETIDTGRELALSFPEKHPVESVYRALVLGIRDYVQKCGFQSVVLGLSGGIDSALTASLAAAALGPGNVLGISMPSSHSSKGSVEDSRKLAYNLGIRFKVISIAPLYNAYLESLRPYFAGVAADLTEENLQARIRGNILMAFSNKFGYLVLSTGNKSELAVGYCTLYGDMSGGLSVLADVPKTMVYELAEYINREQLHIPREIIVKPPSAELRPGQTDQDELPAYDILDKILHLYIEEGLSATQLVQHGFDQDTVLWVIRAVDRNEYKRRQAPPGLKVTTKAFGSGRRMPIATRIHHHIMHEDEPH